MTRAESLPEIAQIFLQTGQNIRLTGVALVDALAAGTCCLTGAQHPGVLGPDVYRRVGRESRRRCPHALARRAAQGRSGHGDRLTRAGGALVLAGGRVLELDGLRVTPADPDRDGRWQEVGDHRPQQSGGTRVASLRGCPRLLRSTATCSR
jgi:hypothetical protein